MTNDMTVGNPRSLILKFAIPLIIGNIFQQFYNVVDSAVVGRFIGVNALAAVGATGSVVFLIMGVVMGMTSGFSVLIAQSFGAKDEKRVRHFTVMSGYLSVIITIVLTVGTLLGIDSILRLMKTPDDIFADSSLYIKIIFAGIGITMLYNMLSAILRAIGDSKTPLIFLAIASVINVVLDLLFVVVFKMGVEGVAYATVIAQAVSAILCLVYMIKKYPILRIGKEDLKFSSNSAFNLMKIGIPMSLQFSITAIGVMIIQAALNVLGSLYIAAYTAASKAQQIVTQPFASLGATMATYVGQNTGAGKIDRIRQGMKEGIKITLIYSVLAAVFLIFFGKLPVKMFVSGGEREVIDAAQHYFNIVVGFFPALGLIFIYRNTLQGLGDGFFPMIGGIFELIARGVVAFTLAQFMGYAGVCFADPVAWVSALIPIIPVYYIRIKKMSTWKN
ncbi:MATE family efflux transporter [Candidatus Galacturonibacter soehngenii]|uniref:Probable multidrug resistance protein NorM n=1 Tax=Candidatus Galacturonatibacter soehngenii TaxID=2307010 RepID=A0A7V7QNS4_9FIRM|nr:MATE family efflux transporter [Candidatus Galacturonibacter soehngenii]KAB1440148.1 MATE family efflux transporter [Candidatus Galacturonibacter soehngenii]MBA4686012.1 MATE family efflux transporter [Candidatus Galacturonibacter soehngenii]